MYLSCEDRVGVLHWRFARICRFLGISLASLRGWLEVFDLVGQDSVLWERDPRTGHVITGAYGCLSERIKQHGTQVLFVDGISDTFGGNENAKTEVKRYVNALVALVPPDDGGIVLIGHVAKSAASAITTTEGYSGTTGWHNAVRARWYLYPRLDRARTVTVHGGPATSFWSCRSRTSVGASSRCGYPGTKRRICSSDGRSSAPRPPIVSPANRSSGPPSFGRW